MDIYDVINLYNNVPLNKTLCIVRNKLKIIIIMHKDYRTIETSVYRENILTKIEETKISSLS